MGHAESVDSIGSGAGGIGGGTEGDGRWGASRIGYVRGKDEAGAAKRRGREDLHHKDVDR